MLSSLHFWLLLIPNCDKSADNPLAHVVVAAGSPAWPLTTEDQDKLGAAGGCRVGFHSGGAFRWLTGILQAFSLFPFGT